LKEKVLLVDSNDQVLGKMEKIEAHEKGLLHRAFSVFVYNNNGELLMQKRAFSKYHTPGLWTNTCCSHQREDETNVEAGKRRLQEEMGFTTDLEDQFSFITKLHSAMVLRNMNMTISSPVISTVFQIRTLMK